MPSLFVDTLVAELCKMLGLTELGAPAEERIMVHKVTAKLHEQWAFMSGVHRMQPTPQNVSKFLQDSFGIPFDMPDQPDGRTMSRADRQLVFTKVAQILIGQGRADI